MDRIIDYARDAVPARYELSWSAPSSIFIRVRAELVDEIKVMNFGHFWVPNFQREFGLGDFVPPQTGDWGFEAGLRGRSSQDPRWVEWECFLPVIRDLENNSAQSAVRATLTLLFTSLHVAKTEPGGTELQLLTIDELRVGKGLHGGSLQATLTPTTIKWLATRPDDSRLVSVEQAMIDADKHMWPIIHTSGNMLMMYQHQFHAWCRQPKWINLSVPGNACGLDPNDYYNKSLEEGYQLSPHNVDSGLQQLALLAGLAKLHDLVRRK